MLGELRAKTYDDSVIAKGRELTSITGRIMLSRFTDGLDDLRKFKAAHADEKWLQEVEGDFTGPLLRSPDDQFTELRAALGFDAILDYDAQAALRRVRTPMLWIVAGKDTEAPPLPTLEFLRALQPAPPQLDIAIFPNADHGILEGDRAVRRLSRSARDVDPHPQAGGQVRHGNPAAGSASLVHRLRPRYREYPRPPMGCHVSVVACTRSGSIVPAVLAGGAASAADLPRMPDGTPDLQGIWTSGTLTPFERPPQAARSYPRRTAPSRRASRPRSSGRPGTSRAKSGATTTRSSTSISRSCRTARPRW